MEQLNSDPVGMATHETTSNDLITTTTTTNNKSLETKIQVSSHFQRNGRRKLEDRFVVEHNLNQALDLDLPHNYRYYAIFDGHVNEQAAEYCKNNLHLNLVQNDKFKNGDIKQALKEVFLQTDQEFCDSIASESTRPGTTALVCLIEDEKRFYFAWAGDSTAWLIRNGQPNELTPAHSPEVEEERNRIKEMGGDCIHINIWRVMGILAVSRSIGDPDYKPYVTADPDVIDFELDGTEDFIVLASDGLYDGLSAEDVTTIVYEFLALNASQLASKEQHNDIIDRVSKLLIERSIDEGSSDNITTIVLFLKDLDKIAPSLFTTTTKQLQQQKSIKQNGHQNGHHMNGHHDDELNIENGLNNGTNKENGDSNRGAFILNVNATPYSPNNDLFNSISMSRIESIRISRQQQAWQSCLQAASINVTSNEDNQIDDNLQCAIDNDNEMLMNNQNNDEEQPHSILPNINDHELHHHHHDHQKTTEHEIENEEQQPQFTERKKENKVDVQDDDDELQRELDEECVRVIDDGDKKLDEFVEDENNDDHDDVAEELKMTTDQTELVVNEKQNNNDESTTKTVECEYGIIPTESVASPIDLISESTTTDQNDNDKDSNENRSNSPFDDKGSNENLPNSPFEQIEEHHLEAINEKDLVVKDEEPTTTKEDEHIDEKSDENSFEFISNQNLDTDADQQAQQNQNDATIYESPSNSKIVVEFQEELSVYENANTNFDNSVLNKDLFNRNNESALVDEQHDDDEDEEAEHDETHHPFENDSEDSIKYLDKTATEEKINRALEHAIESVQTCEINDLANLMENSNLNEVEQQNAVSDENADQNRTINLLENTQDQENIDEMNKENVPCFTHPIKPTQPTLLDTTVIFNGNPPNLIEPSSAVQEEEHQQQQQDQQLEHINEDHFDVKSDNDNQELLTAVQDTEQSIITSSSNNFEMIKNEELIESNNLAVNEDDNQTNYKLFDMELTRCTAKTEDLTSQLNTKSFDTNQINTFDEVPNLIDNNNTLEEAAILPHDTTLKNSNSDGSNNDYTIADQDPSFIHKLDEQNLIEETVKQPIDEPAAIAVEEHHLVESKDNFVILESETQQLATIDDNASNANQLTELKPESNEEQLVDENKSLDNKPGTVDETPKEKESLTDKAALVAGSSAVAIAAAAVGGVALKKKTATTTTTTTNKQPLNKTKLTKDTKTLASKDSKSTIQSSSTKDTKSTTTKKPVATSTATTTRKPLTGLTTKPLASKLTSKTTTTVPKQSTVTKSALTTNNKPTGVSSKVSSTLKSTVTSRLNNGTTAGASSKAPSSSSSSQLTSKQPISKQITSKPLTSKLTTSAKSTSDTKSTLKSTTTSRPATAVASKYANVTSKVSSSLSAKPTSSVTAKTSTTTTGLAATKRPLSSISKTTSTKPSSTTTANKLTGVTSKVSSLRSTTTTTASSRLTSATSKPVGTSKLATKTATTTTTTANKKTTAVPRKPVSKQLGAAALNSKSTTTTTTATNNNTASPAAAGALSVESKNSESIVSNNELIVNENSSNNSIKPNSQLMNGQTNSNNLSNGDGNNSQSKTTATTTTTTTTMTSSITSSKSRDKLANSLKAELEAAMLTESLPK